MIPRFTQSRERDERRGEDNDGDEYDATVRKVESATRTRVVCLLSEDGDYPATLHWHNLSVHHEPHVRPRFHERPYTRKGRGEHIIWVPPNGSCLM